MKNLKDIKGYVRLTMDKHPEILVDPIRLDDNWQEWDFHQLVNNLRRWTKRTPKTASNPEKHFRRENLFQVRYKDKRPTFVCVYCENPVHKSSECKTVSGTLERRLVHSRKKLCFNRTGLKQKENTTPQFVKNDECSINYKL